MLSEKLHERQVDESTEQSDVCLWLWFGKFWQLSSESQIDRVTFLIDEVCVVMVWVAAD